MIRGDSRAVVWRCIVWFCLSGVVSYTAIAETQAPAKSPDPPVALQPSEIESVSTPDLPSVPTIGQAPEVGTAETTNAPAAPAAEQPPAVESASSPDDTPDPAESQAAEAVTTITPVEPAAPAVEQPSLVAPALVPEVPAALTEDQAPGVEKAATPDESATPVVEQPSLVAPALAPEVPAAPSEDQVPGVDAIATPVEPAIPTAEEPSVIAPAEAPGTPDAPDSVASETQPTVEPALTPDEPAPQDGKPNPELQTVTAESRSIGGGKKSILKTVFSNVESSFTLTTGVRKDDFQWSIAGDGAGANPNVLSELSWSDVDSYEVALTNRTIFNRLLYFRGALNYAIIQNGRIQDSDYRDDNRGDEFSRSISDSGGDQIWDASLAAGAPFFFNNERLMVAPLLGYSYHVQNFRIKDGEQVITWPSGPAIGPLSGLNSTYRSTWQGPWIGCDLRYRPSANSLIGNRPMEFGLSFEYHYADYKAEANWNLRSDFQHPVSFEHFADGHGITLAGELLIGLTAQWDFVFQATYQHWKTGNGLDQVYRSNGTVGQARLNEVEWSNHSIMVGATFRF